VRGGKEREERGSILCPVLVPVKGKRTRADGKKKEGEEGKETILHDIVMQREREGRGPAPLENATSMVRENEQEKKKKEGKETLNSFSSAGGGKGEGKSAQRLLFLREEKGKRKTLAKGGRKRSKHNCRSSISRAEKRKKRKESRRPSREFGEEIHKQREREEEKKLVLGVRCSEA